MVPLAARGGIGAFCTLGNGLIQDRIEGIVGAGNLLACLVEWGGTNVGPGRLVRDSQGGYVVGELDGAPADAHSGSPRRCSRSAPRASPTTCAG